MNPLHVKAQNFRSFGDLDLDLPAGCVAVVGANGAGKSSFVSLVDLCLFGPDGRSWAPYLTQGVESTELLAELEFEHAEALYRVRRGYSARGGGKTSLDLERWETRHPGGPSDDWWNPVTREGQKATQELVEEIVGLTRETFRASAMVSQGDAASLTEAKPADRKRILSTALGLARFDRLAALAKRDRKAAAENVARIKGALDRADVEIATRPDVARRLAAAREILAAADIERARHEAALQEATDAAAAADRTRAALAEAVAAAAAAEAALQPLEQRAAEAAAAEAELGIANDEIASLTTAEQRAELDKVVADLSAELAAHREKVRDRDELLRMRETRLRERDAILAQLAKKREETTKLADQADHVAGGTLAACPTCEQALGAEAREATVGNLRARAQVAADEAVALEQHAEGLAIPEIPPEVKRPIEVEHALDEIQKRLTKAHQDDLQRERLAGRVQELQRRVAGRPDADELAAARSAAQAARAAAAAAPPAPDAAALQELHTAAQTARVRLEERRLSSDAARADAIREDATLERLDALEAASAADRKERDELLAQVDRLTILERAYGRDGIPAMIVDNVALPFINREATRILEELGTSYRLELRSEKPLAGGGTAGALDIVVITDTGERSYETFSGGEQTRLNLALRIAFAELLATRRGAESRLLAIDEPDGLDEAGMAALVRVLEGLNGTFDKTYLVSHHPELQTAFPQTLRVFRNGDGLSCVEAA